jgi:hypothetical protein
MANRELFWQNVMREILTNLSMLSAQRPPPRALPPGAAGAATAEAPVPPPPQAPAPGAESTPADDDDHPELFDGRLAVITRQGQRVPIADVFPLFACGISTPRERMLSIAVECTVFQIRTPGGEVFTLPLHELRSFHALTPELMHKLERAARRQMRSRPGADEDRVPFGFAAFTSLARGGPSIIPQAPDYPTE